MNVRLLTAWGEVRASYWFVPTVMAGLAFLLALATLRADEVVQFRLLGQLPWVYIGGPEGARSLLATAAGSLIGVAGITFSIAIAALALASSQYGPRLLRNFMRDTGNQVVLGTFIATFLYCLLVLRTVRSPASEGEARYEAFVPYLSVTVSIGLTIASLGVLIYFIHHIAVSIQAATIITDVGRDLDRTIERLFPEKLGHEPPAPARLALPSAFDRDASPIAATGQGYLQAVDGEALMRLATERDLLLRLERRPGDYVMPGSPLALVWPGDRADNTVADAIQAALTLGAHRTLTQDVRFGVDQLVEVAVRSLSPSLNDPFTAIMCVDRLGAALARAAGRQFPSPYRYDSDDRLRLVAEPVTLVGLINAAFDPIRQYGRSSVAVAVRLLETIAALAWQIDDEAARRALRQQALLIERGSRQGVTEEWDRQVVAERFERAMAALGPTCEGGRVPR